MAKLVLKQSVKAHGPLVHVSYSDIRSRARRPLLYPERPKDIVTEVSMSPLSTTDAYY